MLLHATTPPSLPGSPQHAQVIAFEVSLHGGSSTGISYITSALTLLALAVLIRRFMTDLVFKMYRFLEMNEKVMIQVMNVSRDV
jgi:hypothetical protein